MCSSRKLINTDIILKDNYKGFYPGLTVTTNIFCGSALDIKLLLSNDFNKYFQLVLALIVTENSHLFYKAHSSKTLKLDYMYTIVVYLKASPKLQ